MILGRKQRVCGISVRGSRKRVYPSSSSTMVRRVSVTLVQ